MDIELKAGCELRIEIPPNTKAKFVLAENTAEISGQELLLGKWYTVKEEQFFIFTYTGCKIKLAASNAFYYISEETNIPYIFNVFHYLHKNNRKKLLIVGSGRSTCANILTNYFIRKGKKVMYTDLDIYSGTLLFPGNITNAIIQEPFSPIELATVNDKLAYFCGSLSASDNTDLYNLLLHEVLATGKQKSYQGVSIIIGHKEITKKEVTDLLAMCDSEYFVLVVGDEKFFNQISTENKIYIPRFPGLVERNTEQRRKQISSRIKTYFYGEQEEYSPCTISIRLTEKDTVQKNEYKIVQVGDEYMAPMSALPLGSAKRKVSTAVLHCSPVEGSVLAVSSAEKIEDVPTSPVIGYLIVLEVISESEIKVICPQPKSPNKPFLIQGKIRMMN
ncbi:polyribonucleotide 5'-hydroxyl-kinase [Nematocida minor]|uniref:polyribonucleotide 5'-hydroxyl-kinase n=1 Tax=Nematocida minor TaxID=1912983 RepID=UPI0022211E43|nr:polyribonucleotide 5'-hydroxyl-kinase [Nematocida minor]KAI5190013.1 polyribonucleotide 5'-hydroxyl-kinase [Nematocida minor]